MRKRFSLTLIALLVILPPLLPSGGLAPAAALEPGKNQQNLNYSRQGSIFEKGAALEEEEVNLMRPS